MQQLVEEMRELRADLTALAGRQRELEEANRKVSAKEASLHELDALRAGPGHEHVDLLVGDVLDLAGGEPETVHVEGPGLVDRADHDGHVVEVEDDPLEGLGRLHGRTARAEFGIPAGAPHPSPGVGPGGAAALASRRGAPGPGTGPCRGLAAFCLAGPARRHMA